MTIYSFYVGTLFLSGLVLPGVVGNRDLLDTQSPQNPLRLLRYKEVDIAVCWIHTNFGLSPTEALDCE